MRRVLLLACLSACHRGAVELPDGAVDFSLDADGDTIADGHEGARDTDADGQPDYLDTDSDGDSIPDAVEAGDADPSTPPIDSDLDGSADFVDQDSDANRIPDARELPGDVDGDGTANFADHDDDADTILDREDLELDTDRDGTADMHDTDSDADGFSDAVEAGDADLSTPPVDTDDDGILDFRDPDSDGDGLSDARERALGTSRTRGDIDGDAVSDLIEVGAGTDPLDAADNPRARGDFVFVVPYDAPPLPARDTLHFTTDVQLADVYFLFDKSGSMNLELDSVRSAVRTILENLSCTDYGIGCANDPACGPGRVCGPSATCVEDPSIADCIPSIWTGVGVYGGSSTAYPIDNLHSLDPDPAATEAAIPTSVGVYGSDEVLFQAAACVADPTLCPTGRIRNCASGGVGCPAFRSAAMRILVQITDEPNQYTNSAFTANSAGLALSAAGITFVGVDADALLSAGDDLRAVAGAAGSLDSAGAELVYDGDEAAVEIRRLNGETEETVVALPDVTADFIRVVADDDIWLLAASGDLYHWDGAAWQPISFIDVVEHVALVEIVGIDAFAAAPGQAAALVQVWGQGDNDYMDQLCLLDAGVWSCARTQLPEAGVETRRITIAGGTVWMAESDGQLYRLDPDGTRVLVGPGRIDQLQALDDGSLAYLRVDGSIHRVVDGADSVLVSGASWFVGNRLDGLFVLATDYETDGSCNPIEISCTEGTLWSQLIVYRVDSGRLVEIAHHDDPNGGGAFGAAGWPLPDGRVVIGLEGDGTFVTQ